MALGKDDQTASSSFKVTRSSISISKAFYSKNSITVIGKGLN